MKPLQLDLDALWKRRFAVKPRIGVAVAPAMPGRGVALSYAADGNRQIFAWDVARGDLRQITQHATGVSEGWITPDGQYIYYHQDEGGNERGHIYRVPYLGGASLDVTPDLEPYVLRGVSFSGNGRMLAFNAINADGFQVYAQPLAADGTPDMPLRVHQSYPEVWKALLSYDGALVAAQSTARAAGQRLYSILVFDATTAELLAELWDGASDSVEPVAFAPLAGDTRLLAHTTRSGYRRPLIWDPVTGARRDLDLPGIVGDVLPLAWAPDGQRILLNGLSQAVQQLYIYDLTLDSVVRLEHPAGSFGAFGGEFGGCAYFATDDEIFAHWQDATHCMRTVALDGHTGIQSHALLAPEDPLPGRPWRSITFTSSDGQAIQGWLSTPEGHGPFPTILATHGGPHVAVTETFSPLAQLWTDHGYAYLMINYRGSTTFGRPFQEQIWGDLGNWEIEDMVAARDWLVDQGVARPEAILLMGASYGGYLTLLGLGKRPDLWAGGIALVAIADWRINYEDSSDALKGAIRAWFAGTTPEDNPEQYRKSSPITYAADIQAPVLIIQGENDTRTAARQMEYFEAQMRKLGKDIELRWFSAGHQGVTLAQDIAFFEDALRFARRVLSSERVELG